MSPMNARNTLPFTLVLAIAVSCSTSKISIRKDELKKLQTVAIVPFSSAVANAKVTRESSELFRGTFVASGLKVVEREKLDKVLKEKELVQTGLVENKAIEAGSFLGAEATLFGEITSHEMKSETREVELPSEGLGSYDPLLNRGDASYFQKSGKWFRKEKIDTFYFQIVLRMVSNIDSQTILTLQNEYPVKTFDQSNSQFRPADLDQFRSQVLAQMSKDLEKAIREARE